MTPEEKAVIDAAMALEYAVSTGDDPVPWDETLRDAVWALIYACSQCNAGGHACPGDGNPISHTATDCGGHEACGAVKPDDPVWTPSTFLYVLAGDRIRIGTDETDVLRSSSGAWHANVVSSVLPSGKVWDKVTPWEHTELRLDLSANPGFREYPADTPCEILCTPERLAVLTLMTVFPGTKEIKP